MPLAASTDPKAPLFDSDFLKKLEYLSLVSRRVFRGQLLAQRRTTQLGGGIEFADHRAYTPGDDFRYLDWNLFARHDELLLKRFQEEEDLHIYIFLDCSRSMAFGTPPKFDYARQVAAALAYIALAELDRVAVLAFARDIVADFPLTRGKARILSLLDFLKRLGAQGDLTDLAGVAQNFVHRSQRRGLVLVISDLFDPSGYQRGLDVLRHHRYEPHVVQIYDRREAEPDLKGDLELFDIETERVEKVTITERKLRQYRQLFAAFLESVSRYCNGHGIGGTCTTTEVPFDALILKMMRAAGGIDMNLVNPTALLLAGLAVPIIALYILKVRLRRAPVSTLLFWRQIFEEKRPRSLWQQLRHWISLLLQLAFLSLLVAALADPIFRWQQARALRLVLVVDNSASMNAADVLPSRLQAARIEGRRLIDGMRVGDEMAIIAAGTIPQVVCGMTDHQRTLRGALDAVPPSDGPTQVPDAVTLGRRLLGDASPLHRIVVVTDAAFEGAAELSRQEGVAFVSVGRKTPNLGITRMQARRSLLDPIGYEILVEVMNASDDPAECRLELDLDGEPIDVVPLALKPGEHTTQLFQKTSIEGGLLRARLDRNDALAADNAAVALLPRRSRQRVRIETTGNLFLEKVFEAMPLVDLDIVKDPAGHPPAPAGLALTVLHRRVPAALPAGPLLLIEPDGPCSLWQVGEKLQNPVVAKQDGDSPLMAHIRLDQVLMPEARKLSLAAGSGFKVLAETATGDPLYAVCQRPEGTVAVLTVDLDKSDLPLQTAFPIMMTNLMSWLAGTKGELRESLATGSETEVTLAPETDARAVRILRSPSGVEKTLPGSLAKVSLGPLDGPGVWKVIRRTLHTSANVGTSAREGSAASPAGRHEETLLEIACNLSDSRETDIRPAAGVDSRPVSRLAGLFARPVWFYLVICAWCLTSWEWYLYQRRWID